MIDYDRYDQALIVSGDGDFTCLLRYLGQNNKLLGVLAPYEKGLSSLIQKLAGDKIEYLRTLRKKIEYRPVRNTRARTKPLPPMQSDIRVTDIKDTNPLPQKTSPSSKLTKHTNKRSKSRVQSQKNTLQTSKSIVSNP